MVNTWIQDLTNSVQAERILEISLAIIPWKESPWRFDKVWNFVESCKSWSQIRRWNMLQNFVFFRDLGRYSTCLKQIWGQWVATVCHTMQISCWNLSEHFWRVFGNNINSCGFRHQISENTGFQPKLGIEIIAPSIQMSLVSQSQNVFTSNSNVNDFEFF